MIVMTIKDIIKLYVEKLKNKNIQDADFKVKILLMHILQIQKSYLIVHNDEEVSEEKMREIEEKMERMEKNEPIQYVIHYQEFFGLVFYVDENVLIPQPDTEILVEECIKICNDSKNFLQGNSNIRTETLKILDLCTGSGAIAVSIGKNISQSQIFASDISEAALEVSKKNAIQNEVEIAFVLSDMFQNMNEKFHLIVSNPPYIETATMETLSEEVKKEPQLALDGGEDGLKFYRQIAEQAKAYLEDNGFLALEIGYNQRKAVEKILENNGFRNIYAKKDLGGNDRIVIAQK